MKQIQQGEKEFYEVLEFFERIKPVSGRYDRVKDKDYWRLAVYEDGEVQKAFNMFFSGVNFGIHFSRDS